MAYSTIYPWPKDYVEWIIGKTHYFSIPFTWNIPKALEAIKQAKAKRMKCVVGGPAAYLMPEKFEGLASVEPDSPVEPLLFHNPLATFTSRGCPRKCHFCSVPKTEGELTELESWRLAPIVCDNNFLACSMPHIRKVIERLRHFEAIDINQGLDARLFNAEHADILASFKHIILRFAFDHVGLESKVIDAIRLAKSKGFKDIRCMVLIGYKDTKEDALYRLELLRKEDVLPNPMRFQSLTTLVKNSEVGEDWTEGWLRDVMKYYARLNYLGHISFDDFRGRARKEGLFREGELQ